MLALATVHTACAEEGDPAPASGGPLASPADQGGVSVLRPKGADVPWPGSFSGLPLCLEGEGTTVRVKEFRPLDLEGEVRDVRTFISDRSPGADPGQQGLIFMSAIGRAPEFAEPYARQEAAYARQFSFEDDLSTDEIVEPCSPGVQDNGTKNLVVTFSTDERGGAVRRWELHYEAGGVDYTTGPVEWSMVLCGSDPALADDCAP